MGIEKIFQILVPKQKNFFILFEKSAENLVQSAELLKKLMSTNDQSERETLVVKIKELETTGDNIAHQIYEELNTTFITPFDRDDIHELASAIDDVVDMIDSASQKVKLYKPKSYMDEFLSIADLILDASKEIKCAVEGLRNLKKSNNCITACIKINEIENKADIIYHYAISQLFEKEPDAIELIKKKAIIEALERATDRAEDTSDIIKTIIIKSA
ncbi:MAG: DUF47 family protein [Bacteroidales bacterium]